MNSTLEAKITMLDEHGVRELPVYADNQRLAAPWRSASRRCAVPVKCRALREAGIAGLETDARECVVQRP